VNTRLKKVWSRLSGCGLLGLDADAVHRRTTSPGIFRSPFPPRASPVVPSSTAFATSDTRPRVGTARDHRLIIWVAVMVSLLCSRPSRIISLQAGTGRPDLHREIARRHHDAVERA